MSPQYPCMTARTLNILTEKGKKSKYSAKYHIPQRAKSKAYWLERGFAANCNQSFDFSFCFFGCFKGLFILQHNIRKCNRIKLNGLEELWTCSLPCLSLQFLEFHRNVPSFDASSDYLAEMLYVYKSPKCTFVNRMSLERGRRKGRGRNPPTSHRDCNPTPPQKKTKKQTLE